MATKFPIKINDTADKVRVAMEEQQDAVNGVTPPSLLWYTDKPINNVFFSMKKIPQLQSDGSYLYPDGTIHNTDGTILNPLGNTNVVINNILLTPGDILQADYSVLKTNGDILYPNGIIKNSNGTYDIPNGSLLLQNGMVSLPATAAYPTGYIYNPGDVSRTNYYLVGNPTDNLVNPDGTINLPDSCTLSSDFDVEMPPKVLQFPKGISLVSQYILRMPTGTTKEASTIINRDNALLFPRKSVIHPTGYDATYNSTTKEFQFTGDVTITKNDLLKTAQLVFHLVGYPDQSIEVPYTTFSTGTSKFIFPYGTEFIFAERKFIFPSDVMTLPTNVTITTMGLYVFLEFPTGTTIDETLRQVTLNTSNYLSTDGVVHTYDGSTISLNTNHITLYNDFVIYPRGTQKNSYGTIYHPDGYTSEGSYLRYYPVEAHPTGLLVRADGAIVNIDGTFTRLDNSVVNSDGQVVREAGTEVIYYDVTPTTPIIPVLTQSDYIVINKRTGSYSDYTYVYTGSITKVATVLEYQWHEEDTAHGGLYTAEFLVKFNDGTQRTFPILADDGLFIEIYDHFNADEEPTTL